VHLFTPAKPHPLDPSPLHFALKAKVFRLRAQGEGGDKLEGLRPSYSSLAQNKISSFLFLPGFIADKTKHLQQNKFLITFTALVAGNNPGDTVIRPNPDAAAHIIAVLAHI
jgi:hypothetical protein